MRGRISNFKNSTASNTRGASSNDSGEGTQLSDNFCLFILMYISSTGYHYKQNENKIELFVVNIASCEIRCAANHLI